MTSTSQSNSQSTIIVHAVADDSPASGVVGLLGQHFKNEFRDVEIYDLSEYVLNPCDGCYAAGGRVCLSPCDYNDVESEIYDADDKGVFLLEAIRKASAVVVVGEARPFGTCPRISTFLERLRVFENEKRVNDSDQLHGKVASVVVLGDNPAVACNSIVGTLTHFGFIVAASEAITLSEGRDAEESEASFQKQPPDLRNVVDKTSLLVRRIQ